MDHAWCNDVARDAAVRAAEDGRTGPLPTLKECIAAITNHDAPPGARVSDRQCASPADTGADTAGRDMGNNVFVASTAEVLAMHEETVKALTAQRDAAIGERDEARQSWLRSEESGTRLLAQRNASLDDADALRKRVAELEAASGGGEGAVANVTFHVDDSAERARYVGMTVKPLRRPQPRGWLTNEERELIAGIADDDEYTEEGQDIAKGLLARSTPPEVVLPENPYHPSGLREGFDHAIRIVRNELVNAGVEVKDAPK